MLGYRAQPKHDGKFHDITVKVTRPGVQVRARKGYYAVKTDPTKLAAAPPPDPLRDMLLSPMALRGLTMRATADVVKGPAQQSVVQIAVEIDGNKLGFDEKSGTFVNKVEWSYIVLDGTGAAKTNGKRTADFALTPKNKEAVAEHGLRFATEFELPPGRYQFRVAGKEGIGGRTGSVFWDVWFDRHIHRRKGRHRSARTGSQPPRRHPPAQGNDPRYRPGSETSRSPTGAQPWPRSSSTGSSATPCSCRSSRSERVPDASKAWPEALELLEIVERCALAKRRLVLSDERDTDGVRMALNLGHTVSNALEAATGYRIRHGEAVAYGLRAALDIGVSLGVTPTATANRATRLMRRFGLGQDRLDVSVAEVLSYVESDKKRRAGKPRWVLVATDGVTIRDDVPADIVRSAVTRALAGVPARNAEAGHEASS